MTNLEEKRTFFKKNILPFVFIMTLAILFSLIYTRYFKKVDQNIPPKIEPVAPSQNRTQKAPQQYQISKNLKLIDAPKELEIFKASKQELTESYAKNIANNFNLTVNPRQSENSGVGAQYLYYLNGLDLAIDTNEIRLKDFSKSPTSIKKTLDELEIFATRYINNFNFMNQKLLLDPQKTNYLTVENERYKSSDKESATFYEFFFNLELSGRPLLKANPSPSFARLIIAQDATIRSFNVSYPSIFEKGSLYPIKSPKTALSEISEGKGTLMAAKTLDEFGQTVELSNFEPTIIQNATIDKMQIAYLQPTETSTTVQPIYVFEGKFKTKTNQNGLVILYLPAISTQP